MRKSKILGALLVLLVGGLVAAHFTGAASKAPAPKQMELACGTVAIPCPGSTFRVG